ncbi:hypothetical protein E5161_05130 [Cohnella pontilimi]|uniref:Lipoprotein n=1 Tax=Cohnella pontilimi TaxID=2564100 RepID=A0A4U0FEN3_9BACL|nr:hypothetical protein [Cohnella pontilimi]TJY43281.1 hypothetical protein E5161_05130 [Cohnella pontilimi]
MRTRMAVFALLCLALTSTGCMQRAEGMPADKAFALSASALSGSDSYGVAGEIAVYDPNGAIAGKSRYEGEVTGHGKINVKWSDSSPLVRTQAAGTQKGQPAFPPLQLLNEVKHGKATVKYADRSNEDRVVKLLVTLDENTATKRIAEGLRAEIRGLRTDVTGKSLSAKQRKQAEDVLSKADRTLDEALSTLRVRTVCLWTADRSTWFPRQMREETVLSYRWNGKPYREKRVSETNFLRGGSNGTMGGRR